MSILDKQIREIDVRKNISSFFLFTLNKYIHEEYDLKWSGIFGDYACLKLPIWQFNRVLDDFQDSYSTGDIERFLDDIEIIPFHFARYQNSVNGIYCNNYFGQPVRIIDDTHIEHGEPHDERSNTMPSVYILLNIHYMECVNYEGDLTSIIKEYYKAKEYYKGFGSKNER